MAKKKIQPDKWTSVGSTRQKDYRNYEGGFADMKGSAKRAKTSSKSGTIKKKK